MKEKSTILVIDDSEETVSGLHNFFTDKYEVLTASNGLDGLKLTEENESEIDLIITDLMMPVISGVGVISIIRKKYPSIPVIAITGWGDLPERLAARADADLVLGKPFELFALDKQVSEMLAKKKM